ncbi:MAG: IS481 family transposase [Gemmatimonadales bacterium]
MSKEFSKHDERRDHDRRRDTDEETRRSEYSERSSGEHRLKPERPRGEDLESHDEFDAREPTRGSGKFPDRFDEEELDAHEDLGDAPRSRSASTPRSAAPSNPPLIPGVDDLPFPAPRLSARRRGKRLVKKPDLPRGPLTAEQRLLLLDTWKKSGLPAGDFSALVGVSKHTLYAWRSRFKERGPAGLVDRRRGGPRGSRLPEVTRRAILMMKEEHPDWGTERISDLLSRGPGLAASASSVARVLREAGYELEEIPTRPHRDRVRRFERAKPNVLWQTDLFTFVLKRQNRRVYLVAFLDDHSRFVVGWGLHSTQSTALVLEVLRSAITNHNPPREILSDNGAQYVTWRGRSQFSRELEARGIEHLVARPRRPQTLGKVERFWGTMWREFLERAIFLDLEDARRRLGEFIAYYNFRRPHRGLGGLTPADRFFHAAPKVLEMLRRRVAENALEIARHGEPKKSFYLTGQIEGRSVSVRAEGDRVVVEREGEEREEVSLDAPPRDREEAEREDFERELDTGELPPGVSKLDDFVSFEELEDEEIRETATSPLASPSARGSLPGSSGVQSEEREEDARAPGDDEERELGEDEALAGLEAPEVIGLEVRELEGKRHPRERFEELFKSSREADEDEEPSARGEER